MGLWDTVGNVTKKTASTAIEVSRYRHELSRLSDNESKERKYNYKIEGWKKAMIQVGMKERGMD